MKYLLPTAVFMLMVSVGMSLNPRQLLENWRRGTPSLWGRLLLATGCLMSVRRLLGQRAVSVQTLSICNVNRHVGLPILLAGSHIHDQRPIPIIAAYAFAAILVMALFTKFVQRESADAAVQSR